jgi:hexokinase
MIAGLYLGEVFRLVLTELIDSGDLFLGQNTYKLEKAYAVDTAFLSLMERWVDNARTSRFKGG